MRDELCSNTAGTPRRLRHAEARRRVALLAPRTRARRLAGCRGRRGRRREKRQRLAKQLRLKAFGSCNGLAAPPFRAGAGTPGRGQARSSRRRQTRAPRSARHRPPHRRCGRCPAQRRSATTPPRPARRTRARTSRARRRRAGPGEGAGGRIFVVAEERLHAVDTGGLKLLGSLPLGVRPPAPARRPAALDLHNQGIDSGGRRILPGWTKVTQLTEVDVSSPAAMRVLRTRAHPRAPRRAPA